MPFQSIWPLITAVGVLVGAIGISAVEANPAPGIHAKLAVTLIGGAITFLGVYFWSIEGNEGYHLHLDANGNVIEDHHAKH
jgi:cytochrome c oxidase subunit 1